MFFPIFRCFYLISHRYFPRGGGHVRVEVNPVRILKSINVHERGDIKSINGWSFVAGTLPIKVCIIIF